MENYQLLIDLHKRAKRQGPGGDTETEKAVSLAMIDPSAPLKIADIGCGTGSSAMLLAHLLNAQITAVDFLPEFLEMLETNAKNLGLTEKISTLACSMDKLPFGDEEYDVIWSEGAIYNIGFERGVKAWKRFLKTGGLLVVSEITWLTAERPWELQEYWKNEYPEIDTASAKIGVLEKNGYFPVAYLFYRSIAGWIIIIGLCRLVLKGFLSGTVTVKEHRQSWMPKKKKSLCMRNTKLITATGFILLKNRIRI